MTGYPCEVKFTLRVSITFGKNPVPIVQEAEWAPAPVWTDAENLALAGIRSPDRPARSQSLYRLSYPAHFLSFVNRAKRSCHEKRIVRSPGRVEIHREVSEIRHLYYAFIWGTPPP
jgi:hypothetical protein